MFSWLPTTLCLSFSVSLCLYISLCLCVCVSVKNKYKNDAFGRSKLADRNDTWNRKGRWQKRAGQPDQRSWRERKRKDIRIRVRDRTTYARPDNGKRPKHHSGGHNLKAAIASPLDGQLASRSTAAMNTIYDLLSTAWKRRLEKKAKRRSIILRTHWRRSKKTGEGRVPL